MRSCGLLLVCMVSSTLALSSGCGLLFVPHIQRFPGPVQGVRIVDQETGESLPEARLSAHIQRYENWFLAPPVVREQPKSDIGKTDSDATRVLKVGQMPDGTFTVEGHSTCGSMQSFFPLPTGLGWHLYRTHQAIFLAEAPGHLPLRVSFLPCRMPRDPASLRGCGVAEAACRIDESGLLWIELKTEDKTE